MKSAPVPFAMIPRLGRMGAAPWALVIAVSLGLGGCATAPPEAPPVSPPAAVAPPAPAIPPVVAPVPAGPISEARTAREYRRDGAQHLYRLNAHRIYQGTLPPLLQAVGVMQVELDAQGHIRRFEWMRAPRHVPAVMAEIERTVRAAAPYPAPRRMGGVVYTDTWLWDKSGRFQLDTLTEGQRSGR